MKFCSILLTISLVAIGVNARHELPSRYALARRGNQFVTGPCKQDSDCQQGCCAFKTGKCAGPGIAQTRDGGCGFGNPQPNCNVAAALGLGVCAPGAKNGNLADPAIQSAAKFVAKLDNLPFTPASGSSSTKPSSGKKPTSGKKGGKKGGQNAPAAPKAPAAPSGGKKSVAQLAASQKSKKTVFETCGSDSECQQGCCAFNSGKCAGPGIAQTRDGGCGHKSPAPNCNVAAALKLGICAKGAKNGNLADPAIQAAAAFTAQLDNFKFTPA